MASNTKRIVYAFIEEYLPKLEDSMDYEDIEGIMKDERRRKQCGFELLGKIIMAYHEEAQKRAPKEAQESSPSLLGPAFYSLRTPKRKMESPDVTDPPESPEIPRHVNRAVDFNGYIE